MINDIPIVIHQSQEPLNETNSNAESKLTQQQSWSVDKGRKSQSLGSSIRYSQDAISFEEKTDVLSCHQPKSTMKTIFRRAQSDGTMFTGFRIFCGSLVNNEYSSNFILMCIVINAIMMGIATFDFIRNNAGPRDAFDTIDQIFLIIFTIESGLQFIYNGLDLFTDAWLIFDFTIVVLSWSFASLQVIRAFRVFRAMRVIARIDALRSMIQALAYIVPRMSAIIILNMLFMYIFAVAFTELFKDLELSEDYFSRLDKTTFTLIQIMTLDFGEPMREVLEFYPTFGWIPFISYVVIGGFIIFNLVVAALCLSVAMLKDEVDETQEALDEAGYEVEHCMKLTLMERKIASLVIQQKDMYKLIDFICDSIHSLES